MYESSIGLESSLGGIPRGIGYGNITDEQIRNYLRKVKIIAANLVKKLPSHVKVEEFEDLVSAGVTGLFDTFSKFDSSRGVKFGTFVEYRIKGAMLDYLRRIDSHLREYRRFERERKEVVRSLEQILQSPPLEEEIAFEMGRTLDSYRAMQNYARLVSGLVESDGKYVLSQNPHDDVHKPYIIEIPSNDDSDPYANLSKKEIIALLSQAIDQLPIREKRVISLHYHGGLTLKEIGKVFGVSESMASHLHINAVLKLRRSKILQTAGLKQKETQASDIEAVVRRFKPYMGQYISLGNILRLGGFSYNTFYKRVKGHDISTQGKGKYPITEEMLPIYLGTVDKSKKGHLDRKTSNIDGEWMPRSEIAINMFKP